MIDNQGRISDNFVKKNLRRRITFIKGGAEILCTSKNVIVMSCS